MVDRTGCRVESRFTRRAVLWLAVLLGLLVSACASRPEPVWSYKLYPGPERPLPELAVVQMSDAGEAEFNGRPVFRRDWSEVHLLPGAHIIRWQSEFTVSPLVEPSGSAAGAMRGQVQLEAGRTYRLRAARTTGPGYQMFLWLEDASTGAVVAGTRKP